MKTIFHSADSRGHADHGWLRSHHSFSFAGFHHPEKMGFGLLRVLNDDRVTGGMGFGTHPHENMEIISIPLSGALRHKDSIGNESTIKTGEVQIMSAGTGVKHSEFNPNSNQEVNFLQIWILPDKIDITPRYDQKYFDPEASSDKWQTLVSPEDNGAIWINQHAYISRVKLNEGSTIKYNLHAPGQGAYLFLLEGNISIEDAGNLHRRDAMGIWETDGFNIISSSPSQVLVIEVPMQR